MAYSADQIRRMTLVVCFPFYVSSSWDYPEDSSQIAGLRPGDPVSMLVDPMRPAVAYTLHNVRARTKSGLGPVFVLGVAFLIVGLVGLGWFVKLRWGRRRVGGV